MIRTHTKIPKHWNPTWMRTQQWYADIIHTKSMANKVQPTNRKTNSISTNLNKNGTTKNHVLETPERVNRKRRTKNKKDTVQHKIRALHVLDLLEHCSWSHHQALIWLLQILCFLWRVPLTTSSLDKRQCSLRSSVCALVHNRSTCDITTTSDDAPLQFNNEQ